MWPHQACISGSVLSTLIVLSVINSLWGSSWSVNVTRGSLSLFILFLLRLSAFSLICCCFFFFLVNWFLVIMVDVLDSGSLVGRTSLT